MFLCYAYEVCGTIKVPILLHMVVNMMGIVLTDTPIGSWILEDPMRMGAAIVLSAFIGSSMYVLLRNMKKGEPVHTEETDTGNPPSWILLEGKNRQMQMFLEKTLHLFLIERERKNRFYELLRPLLRF